MSPIVTVDANEQRSAIRSVVLVLCCLGVLGCTRDQTISPPPIVLEQGSVDQRTLVPGAVQRYSLVMAAGDVADIRIAQQGLDIAIRFPHSELDDIDLDYGNHVTEAVWWLAEKPQTLHLEIEALAGQGSYRLSLVKLGRANAVDRQRAHAFWLDHRGNQLIRQQPAEGISELRAALAAWQSAGMPQREALTLGALANGLQDLKEDEQALAAYDQAIALVHGTPEHSLEARLLLRRGLLYKRQGRLDLAWRDNLAARDLAKEARDLHGEATAYNNNAVMSDIRGDLQGACAGFERAWRTYALIDSMAATLAQLSLGRCYMRLGSAPEAFATLDEALRTATSLPKARQLRAKILREVGWWHHLEGEPQRAIESLAQSLALAESNLGVLDRLGTVYTSLGAFSMASVCYRRSLREGATELSRAHALLNLCRLDLRSGHIDAGIERCTQARGLLEGYGATSTVPHALLLLAKLYRHRSLGRAEDFARQTVELIESQRSRFDRSEHRTAFLAVRLEAHKLLIDLRMALAREEPDAGWQVRALKIADLTQARTLLESLESRNVVLDDRSAPDLKKLENETLAQLSVLDRDLTKLRDRGDRPSTQDEERLRSLLNRLHVIRRGLADASPSHAALSQPTSLDVPRLQALLDEKTALIVFHFSKDSVYLWLISRHALQGYLLGERKRIETLAASWYALLAGTVPAALSRDLEKARSRLLSQKLLQPVESDLRRFKRLIFVPDGALLRIPFGALPSPSGANSDRPLIVDHEVLSLPSAGVLNVLRTQRESGSLPAGLLAVIANPSYRPFDKATALSSPTYPPLLGAAQEARALLRLASHAPTLLLEGKDASLQRVVSGELGNYRIVHFATHAETSNARGRSTGLILSQTDESGDPDQNVLGLQELYGLDLPVELVVLSACGTALGEEVPGEGLVGLTRGFMHAGASRVLVSLWAIRDQATGVLMEHFYQHLLNDRLPPGEALRRAQASMFQDGWPARDWAAFVLQGDWRAFPVGP